MTRVAFPTDRATSERMAHIRRHATAPEMTVRNCLWHHGLRFTTQNRDLPGSPDLANRSGRWAIFVHGCFWHGHAGCRRATSPKRNAEAWRAKLAANRERDQRKQADLERLGFEVVTIWECEAGKLARGDRRLDRIKSLRRPPRSEP